MDVIHGAIARGDVKKVKALCEDEPDLLYLDDWQARTPLVLSVLANSLPLVKFFVEEVEEAAQATVDEATMPDGNTAIYYACRDGRVEVARYLLGRGNADPWQQNRYGTTLFMIAATSAPFGHGAGGGDGGEASATGVLLCLLEAINRRGEGGEGGSRLRECLNSRNRNGKTALAMACERGAADVVAVLVAAGANPFLLPGPAAGGEEGKEGGKEEGEAWVCVYEARRAPEWVLFLEKVRRLADTAHVLEKLQEAGGTLAVESESGEEDEQQKQQQQQQQQQQLEQEAQRRQELEETPTDKYLAAAPLALQGRVAQEEEVPRVVLGEEGDEKLREVARHVLIEGGLKPELFVELMEGLVCDWHFEHM